MPRRGGVTSGLLWRYGENARRPLAALAARRSRFAAAAGGKPAGRRDGIDIDDHIRLAVREESAATLGRAGTKLQAAVAALADFDCTARAGMQAPRRALLGEAARALWEYVVQREAMGVTSHDLVNEIYGVTPEVWRLMGSAETVCGPAMAGGQVTPARSAR